VDVKSIGAGGGSIAWLDAGGLLHVGPQSAGAVPGPACYSRGGTRPTVTDCALILGYLDPDSFLGGRMQLDVGAACDALVEAVARPLGLSPETAALAVLDVLTQNMVAAIEEITVKQGVDPSGAVLVAGGGADGFNSAANGRRLGCKATLFPDVGAALSAAGAMLSDFVSTDGRIRYGRSDAPDLALITRTLAELTARAEAFIAAAKAPTDTRIEYWVEARYPQQTWEIEVPVATARLASLADLERVVSDFHRVHQELYAVSDPTSPIEFIAWRVRASYSLRDRTDRRLANSMVDDLPGRRRVYLSERGWETLVVHRLAAAPGGARILGPAIIESDFTTIIVPPAMAALQQPSGTLEVRSTEEVRGDG